MAVTADIHFGVGMHVLAGLIAGFMVAVWRVPTDEPERKTAVRRAVGWLFCVGVFTCAASPEVYLGLGAPMLAAASAGLVTSWALLRGELRAPHAH